MGSTDKALAIATMTRAVGSTMPRSKPRMRSPAPRRASRASWWWVSALASRARRRASPSKLAGTH